MTAIPGALSAIRIERRDDTRPVGWWGMVVLITTEATIFFALLGAYFYVRAGSPAWPQGGIAPPKLDHISVFTVVLLGSSVPLFAGEAAVKHGKIARLRLMLAISFLMGCAFLTNQVIEYRDLGFGLRDNAYASLFYVITGLHGLHVLVGLAMNALVQAKAWTGRVTADRHLTVTVFNMYWHFVDAVWIAVFSSLYVSAHLR